MDLHPNQSLLDYEMMKRERNPKTTSPRHGVEAASTPSEVVTAFIAAFNRRDIDGALALVTDDVEYDNVPMGKVFGPEAMLELLSNGITARATAIEWLVLRQVAEGDTVLNERLDRFLLDDRWVEIPVAGVFETRDGRIALWRDFFDDQTVKGQLTSGPAHDLDDANVRHPR
jgi:limonene-1,2-epoxide hydrolase